ncbi:ketopantoate reductase family protein [Halomarina ordinaria]|uniref:2-dehydropantoate 2-reductase n=1 Tax=Halomarina ordinaria TaxID=3033939 RepID=A0ABD5UEX0_9EURY|nr:ketopantoate reductase family protein [Halomarina sp. PSRA2]
MEIAVIGSGAMGSLYGGTLAEAGHDVTLVDVWEEHVRTIEESGLRLTDDDGERAIPVRATTDPGTVSPPDLALVFVKSTQTDVALDGARPLLDERVDVLSLQNGLGNAEDIAGYVPERNVVAGVTTHGATLEGPGRVFHAGSGPTRIGRYFVDDDDRVDAIAGAFTAAGLPTTVSDAIRDDIWEKVLVNVGINAPTALARVENGALARTQEGRRVVEAAVHEAVAVARHEGCTIRDDIVDHVVDVAERTGTNASSMLQDVRAGRETEVERIHGAVVRRAARHDLAVPVNRTLADLVRLAQGA